MKKYMVFYRTSGPTGTIFFDFDRVETYDIEEVLYKRYRGFKKLEYVFEVTNWPDEV